MKNFLNLNFIAAILCSVYLQTSAYAEILSAHYWVPPTITATVTISGKLHSLTEATLELVSEKQVLTFRLPEDLLGPVSDKIVLTEVVQGNPALLQLSDGLITANCVKNEIVLSCLLKYPEGYGVKADAQVIEDFLKKKFEKLPRLLQDKLNRSTLFRSDPEGLVLLNLKP